MESIRIKPHHLLDILKLHGKGIDQFVLDEEYGHDFYKVANNIVQGKVSTILFTIGEDDICKPCIYNIENKCSDHVETANKSKELHNIKIDKSLMKDLNMIEGESIEFIDVMHMLKNNLNYNLYSHAWSFADKAEIDFRYRYGVKGLEKIASKLD